MAKRYYWLKLKDDFFTSKRIKKLRRIAGGDTYTIIYLKLQLLSLKHDGILEYSGLENTFAEELALDLDESPDDVLVTMNFLINCGLAEASDRELFLPFVIENTGSEGASAQRMRNLRERESAKALPNTSQCDTTSSLCDNHVTERKSKELELEKRDRDISADEPQKKSHFIPPSIEEVAKYCSERGNRVDAEAFVAFYESKGWMIGKNRMKNWKSAVITWERKAESREIGKNKLRTEADYKKGVDPDESF